jgi:thiamine biosynthesis lipoprotein
MCNLFIKRCIVGAVAVLGNSASAAPNVIPQAVELAGAAQGTTYHIKYWGDRGYPRDEVQRRVGELFKQVDRQMSNYRDDSELSRFNRAAAEQWIAVSPETAHVVDEAIKYGRMTDGILDVTVVPLLELWHFGRLAERQPGNLTPPDAKKLEQARRLVGLHHIKVQREPPALRKDAAGVEIDLSSIAPGYTVDAMIELLQSLGFANALVELGGEIRAVGTRPDGTPWRVGIERAGRSAEALIGAVPLKNLALSTAGDYRKFLTGKGRRYTHIIDPRTGQALLYRGAAVTVIAETCIEADALDTPLLVMGSRAGHKWCVEHNVAALFQDPPEKPTATKPVQPIVTKTPRFDELMPETETP